MSFNRPVGGKKQCFFNYLFVEKFSFIIQTNCKWYILIYKLFKNSLPHFILILNILIIYFRGFLNIFLRGKLLFYAFIKKLWSWKKYISLLYFLQNKTIFYFRYFSSRIIPCVFPRTEKNVKKMKKKMLCHRFLS